MLIAVLMFIFSKFFSFIFLLKLGTEVECYMLNIILMFIFPKVLSFIKLWANLENFKILWANFISSCFLHIGGITSYVYAKLQ